MKVIAVHQPTFLPWLGWWNKFARADTLVLLDDVQFPNSGRSWMNRVRVLVDGQPGWITMPVLRTHDGVHSVRETRVDDAKPWRGKIAATLTDSYGEAPYFDEVFPVVEELLRLPTDNIAELNEHGIRQLAARLELDGHELVRQSDLGVHESSNDLLIGLCKKLDAGTYLTGDGADGYLEPKKFGAARLELVEQQYVPPRYPQHVEEHVAGLSIVDALMNCGWDGTAALLSRC